MSTFYTQYKLNSEDQKVLEALMRTLTQFKTQIISQIEEIEINLQNKVHYEIQINEMIKVLEQIENKTYGDSQVNISQIDEITQPIMGMTKINKNTIQFKNATSRIVLSFLIPLQSKLREVMYNCLNTFKLITSRLRCSEKTMDKQYINQQQGKQMEVWKFKSLFKDSVGYQSMVMHGDQAFAESILPLQSQILKGIYLSNIFKGTDTFQQQIDSQNTEQSINLEIHEGFDVSSKIFHQNFKIKHQEFVDSGDIVTDAYKLMFREPVFLKKGCPYSITVSGDKARDKFFIFCHSGKDIKSNQSLLKFLNKEIEQLTQLINIRMSTTYSCIPGYITQSLC